MASRDQACNLVASNLPHNVGDAQLAALFSRFGAVSSVRVMVDVRTGLSRGFGFVLMADQAAADAAVAATGKFIIEVAETKSTGTPPEAALVPTGPEGSSAPARGPPLLIGYAGAGARVPGTPTSTVYVRNLPRTVTAAQVRSFMAAAVPAHVVAAAVAGGRAALVTHVALHLPKPTTARDATEEEMGGAKGGMGAAHGAATDSVRAHVTFATPECAVAAAVATNGVMFTVAGTEEQPQEQATRILVKVVDQDHVKTAAMPRRPRTTGPAGAAGGPQQMRTQHHQQQMMVQMQPHHQYMQQQQQPLVSVFGTSGDHSSSSQAAATLQRGTGMGLGLHQQQQHSSPGMPHLNLLGTTTVPSHHLPLELLQQQLSGSTAGFSSSAGLWSAVNSLVVAPARGGAASPPGKDDLRVNALSAPFVTPLVGSGAQAAALPTMAYLPSSQMLTVLSPSSNGQSVSSPAAAPGGLQHAPFPLQQQQQQQGAPTAPPYFSANPQQPITLASLQQLALPQLPPFAPTANGAAAAPATATPATVGGAAGGNVPLWQPQFVPAPNASAAYSLGYAQPLPQQTQQQGFWQQPPPAAGGAGIPMIATGSNGAPVVVYLSAAPPQAAAAPQQLPAGEPQRPVYYYMPSAGTATTTAAK